jgi:Protein of unknown function (DUF1501)
VSSGKQVNRAASRKEIPNNIRKLAPIADQPSTALIKDLKQRGMLDDTLVVWGGEVGRTVYSQGTLTPTNYGRDHHPRKFTMWLAGDGIRGGIVHGETDDFSYNVIDKPVHIHDLNATILHCLGIHHEKLTYRFQGRRFPRSRRRTFRTMAVGGMVPRCSSIVAMQAPGRSGMQGGSPKKRCRAPFRGLSSNV